MGRTLDTEHVVRTVGVMMSLGLDPAGKILDRYKMFMVLAFMAECNCSVKDVVLVTHKDSEYQTRYFFAEKLPDDARFAAQYDEMKAQYRAMCEELGRSKNVIARLQQENANLRAELGGEYAG